MKKKSESGDLALHVGKAYWEGFPAATKAAIIKLMQSGVSPEEIEARMRADIDIRFSHLPAWKRKEIAGRYYLASDYALQNNLHLN